MENVISVPNAACVKIWGWGKMLPLNIPIFDVYVLAVACCFIFNETLWVKATFIFFLNGVK